MHIISSAVTGLAPKALHKPAPPASSCISAEHAPRAPEQTDRLLPEELRLSCTHVLLVMLLCSGLPCVSSTHKLLFIPQDPDQHSILPILIISTYHPLFWSPIDNNLLRGRSIILFIISWFLVYRKEANWKEET